MTIKNHRLIGVPFFESPNCGGPLTPEILILHYTVSWPASAVVKAFKRPASKASAHLVLDLDGFWTQMVPFHRQAWHAGVSEWRGRPELNKWSIGIEIVNPGPVFPGDKDTRDVNGRVWSGGAKLAVPELLPMSCPATWKYWAPYTVAQISSLERVCLALVQEYNLKEIVRHSDVAPGRKFDPGPLLPMDRIRAAAFNGAPPAAPPAIDPKTLPTLRKAPFDTKLAPSVELAQKRLNAHGASPPLLPDGHFWTKTHDAAKAFQERARIISDGVIGQKTWSLLLASPQMPI